MYLTKRLNPGILVVAFIAMAIGVIIGLAAFVRDLAQNTVKPGSMPITIYIAWLGLVLLVGLVFGRFNLLRAAEFLSRWGI
jgi:hypothetical protein